MAKARQQYQADGSYVDKQEKEFTLTQEIIEKLDSIEPGAERNFIQGIKVNGELQEPDQYRIVGLTIPQVIDELNSTDAQSSLSARQGRVLYNYIKNLQSLGKFLSNWNATTGLPTTNPSGIPYEYHTGDYFVVSLIGATNYRPSGTTYEGIASSVVETEEVKVGDIYFFDGVERLLMLNTERKIPIDTSLSTTSENAVENRVVTQALNLKANDADISVVGKTNDYNDLDNLPNVPDSLDDLSGTSDDIAEGTSHLFLTSTERTKLVNTTGTNTGDETPSSIKTKLGQASTSSDGWLSSTDWNTFNSKQASISDLATIRSNASAGASAASTIATYGDVVTHDANEFATASQGGKAETALQPGDNVSELTNDSGYLVASDLIAGTNVQINGTTISATDTKYTAGANVQISASNVISATDTTYSPSDFDIKDIADSTSLRNTWSGKQDKLQAGVNIEISNDGKTISAIDTVYTAGTGIDITNGVISSTQNSAEWGNISGTLSDQTDLQSALNNKQDTLTAGSNIQIAQDGTISATDTTYTASDFDIKDLADSTGKKASWDAKQNAISDLATIRSGATLGATSIQPGDDISELNNDAGYITSADVPTVNNGTLTIQKNGTNVTTFTANQSGNSTANLIIPTTASDVDALPDTTKYGASIDLSLNSTDYKITVTLKDQDGNTLGTAKTIDLPIESVVVSGSYDSQTKEVVLTLQGGSTIRFSVADLVAGLQTEITSTNKLSADLVDDTSTTHKFVSSTEKSTWNGKQDAISDLATIRSGAALGATALQSISSGDITTALGYTPANDSSVVKTSGNQTIAGTKTFSTSPVVPSKTTAATNSGTAIATEAQVYKKQDALTAGNLISLASNTVKNKALFVITESDVTVTTDDTKGVEPYNTSYGYTNIQINSDVERVEGALYTFIVDTTMVVASANRNVRVRLGSNGTWLPVMNTSAILAGSSYFTKANIRYFQYTTKYQSGGALHLVTDSNTTYSSMTAAEITAGTGTTARTITPANLKTAVQTWSPTVNNTTITFTQGGTTIGDITTNQSSTETVAFQGDIFTTQSNYDNLPSTKLTDGNTYFIYE